jgi:hypothetical protein
MGLKFPDDARCLIPGCRGEPTHKLSVRMRRKDSGADWAPDTPAYFCTRHATNGADVSILYEPNSSKEVAVSVTGVRAAKVVTRTTKITRA